MDYGNQTLVMEFVFVGLANHFQHQVVLFVIFLLVYLVTLLGNLGIVTVIRMDSRLHTPMYFFLSHLALTDMSLSFVTVPKMLMNMQTQQKSIPYAGCMSQIYFFILFGCLDNFLLTVIACDSCVAICHPLHEELWRQELCVSLVVGSWFLCCIHALLHTLSWHNSPSV